jgi:hypothetical protein
MELAWVDWSGSGHALSHPSSFVHQVLFIIIPNAPYSFFTLQQCQNMYSWFLEDIKSLSEATPASCPTLRAVCDAITKDKKKLKDLGKAVVEAHIRHQIYIHRLSDEHGVSYTKKHSAEGKFIVIDNPNYTKFPKETHHHISTKCLYYSPKGRSASTPCPR